MWRDGGIALLLASSVCFLVASAEEMHTERKNLNMSVPRFVKNATEQVLLDCTYDYRLDEKNFVVKWYLNDDPLAVYQWIPSKNSRKFSPLFRQHVDWDYVLAESDKFTKYRPIMLNHPTIEFSGTYQCSVNSKEGHGVAEAKMDVYAPAERITLTYDNIEDNQVNVTCIIKKVFPEPKILLQSVSTSDEDGDGKPKTIEGTLTIVKDNGIHGYDITVNVVLPTSELSSSSDTTFRCEVLLPADNKSQWDEVKYHPQREIAIIEPQVDAKKNNPASTPRISLASLIYVIIALIAL